MTDVYTYIVNLPDGVHEMIAKCLDGYTIYLHAGDTAERQRESFIHALRHIMQDDYNKVDVQEIESAAHRKEAL